MVTTEKKFTYTVDWESGFFLSPRQISTIRSDSTQVIDYYDYLADYPAILSLHKHTEGEIAVEPSFSNRVVFPKSAIENRRSGGMQMMRWSTVVMIAIIT